MEIVKNNKLQLRPPSESIISNWNNFIIIHINFSTISSILNQKWCHDRHGGSSLAGQFLPDCGEFVQDKKLQLFGILRVWRIRWEEVAAIFGNPENQGFFSIIFQIQYFVFSFCVLHNVCNVYLLLCSPLSNVCFVKCWSITCNVITKT